MKALFLLSLFSLSSCAFSSPFRGPLYDEKAKKLKLDPDQKVILALTNAKLDRSKRKGFDQRSREIYQNLEENPGYIAGSVRFRLFGNEVWTMTLWTSLEEMDRFVKSTRHLDAMYMTNEAMTEFRHLHVERRAGDFPMSWGEIEEILQSQSFQPHTPF